MFSWICPKCGKEVPPSYSECPNCAAVQTSAPAGEPPPAARQPAPTPQAAPPRKTGSRVPGWLMSLLFAAVFIIVGLTAWVLLRSRDSSSAAVSPPQQAAAPFQNPQAAAAPAPQTSAAFRNLEISGLRLSEDPKQKPHLRLVLVNHSAADLGEFAAAGNLRAVNDKQEQQEVGTFSIRAKLGPYESSELRVPLETKLRVYEFPDWQFLRAELTPR